MTVPATIFGVFVFALCLAGAVLLLTFVLVPLFKGLGWLIVALFRAVGWTIRHIFEFIAGMLTDTLRLIGAVLATILLAPLSMFNVVIGRWSAAGHFADSVSRECKVAGACLYRVLLRRPLKLFMLHSILEGVEERVPEAMAAAPTSDRPRRRVGQFPGYTITGSLRGGGSGAKLYVASPDDDMRGRYPTMPDRVVIKTFALSEGSTLPQILRESRALESAKQLGLVFEHGMDEHRFFYVMPFHPGDHLGIVTRQLHGETDGTGLVGRPLSTALGYSIDLASTLAVYHRGGLWHKDVKPENIIIDDGHAQLVDLGLVTPLRSAMTLTTHGTEYFRDPELVRQALRGVKVHQVNGAKFDIYAAGAVLYFLMENTFPAHGALSRFSKKSPESLRWIIRRAMADYAHRYETIDAMLEDLQAVALVANPAMVKPADLPSMGGQIMTPPPLPDVVVANPIPVAAMAAGTVADAEAMVTPERPNLKVTNWWTGAYRVEGAAANVAVPGPEIAGLRHDAADLRHKVRSGAMSARKAAKEQIKSARRRARDVRRTAQQRRHRAVAERQPGPALAGIGLVALLLIVGGVALVLGLVNRGSSYSGPLASHSVVVTPSAPDVGLPVLLVMGEVDRDADLEENVVRLVERYRDNGYDIIMNDELAQIGVRPLLEAWKQYPDDERDRALEDVLEAHDLYGVLQVSSKRRGDGLRDSLVWSTRRHAKERRYPVVDADTTHPFLIVNDHPTRHDPVVAGRVDGTLSKLVTRGFELVSDTVLEASVRAAMPTGGIDASDPLTPALNAMLIESELGGVLWIGATQGDDAPEDRIRVRLIERDQDWRLDEETVEIAPLPPGEASAGHVLPRAA